jgi:RHS repeat-associated protein
MHYYYHFDPTGSTVAMTDDAKNVINSYAYDPFGKVTNKTENTYNAFQYVGEYGVMLETNGMLFMRARYYLPELGRFNSRDEDGDAVADAQHLNLFTYTTNNPVNKIDPQGLFPNPVAGITNKVSSVASSIKRGVTDTYNAVKQGASATYDYLFVPGTGVCGPQHFPGAEKFVPDAVGKVNVAEACKHHDEVYGMISTSGLSAEDQYWLRAYADVMLRDEIKATCLRAGEGNSKCEFIADAYYEGVRLIGPLVAYNQLRPLVMDYLQTPLRNYAGKETVDRIKNAISGAYHQVVGSATQIILVNPSGSPSKKK